MRGCIALLVLGLTAASGLAAEFTEADIFDAKSILNSGIRVHAANFGGGVLNDPTVNGAPATTVNGVYFGNDSSALVNGTGAWVFAGGPNNDYSDAFNASDEALDALVSGSANLPSNSWGVVRLRRLVPGFDYRLQIPATHDAFYPNGNPFRQWSLRFPDDEAYNFTMDGAGNGSIPDSLIATFTATAPTMDLRITALGNSDVHLMGYALFLLADTPRGDLDLNGRVDLDDFGLFKSHFGDFANCPNCDLTGDQVVGLDDFAVVKANFGKSSPGPFAVPCPPALLLAAAGCACLPAMKRHARRGRRR